ncbi:MAG: ABC transporter permease [bacterium]|jgi:lipoprotein-releasing system permease protein|nr:ABC transporter permease [bacterium]
MRYELFIAKRYLRPQGGATFIFHLTVISMTGVALGVAALITVLSVMNGFANDIRSKILLGQSHIILKYWDGLANYETLLSSFATIPNVRACSPIIQSWGALYPTDYTSREPFFINFVGIDPDLEPPVTGIEEKIIAGSLDGFRQEMEKKDPGKTVKITDVAPSKPAGILIGKELAASMFGIYEPANLTKAEKNQLYQSVLGQRLTLISVPDQTESLTTGITRDKIFVIEGIFESGYYQYDFSWVYMSLPAAQYLLELPEQITQIQFRLHNYTEAATEKTYETLFTANKSLAGHGAPQTWMQFNSTFFEALLIEKITMRYILMIIIFVATFNIIATLFMVVTEKTRDIGLLRAIGAGRRNILFIFIFLGLIIGAIGAGFGVAGGFFLCKIIQWFPIQMPGGGQIYYVKYLPCEMEAIDFITVSLYTMTVSFLASLYPAFRASRLVPVEALRFN